MHNSVKNLPIVMGHFLDTCAAAHAELTRPLTLSKPLVPASHGRLGFASIADCALKTSARNRE
jgi:hypothetical protein